MKLVTVVGARPQFIKAAAVSRAITRHNAAFPLAPARIDEIIIHTGQHYDKNMSEIFFKEMGLPEPNYFLDIHGGRHGAMTGRMLEKIESVLISEKPDMVLVYGDTNSTLAGALAATKLHIPIAHVEAGLRSFNRNMPEEINRTLTDSISSILFCPTATAASNLEKEGIRNNDWDGQRKIHIVGDVMYDTTLIFKAFAQKPKFAVPHEYILVTLHRAENTDDKARLTSLISALGNIGKKVPVVFPVHPRTQASIDKAGIELDPSIIKVDPVSYLEMLYLIDNSLLIMTDSGGLQKEAYYCHKPCITLRDETEWVELVEDGVNVVAGTDQDLIMQNIQSFLAKPPNFTANIYGTGNTAKHIVNHISEYAC